MARLTFEAVFPNWARSDDFPIPDWPTTDRMRQSSTPTPKDRHSKDRRNRTTTDQRHNFYIAWRNFHKWIRLNHRLLFNRRLWTETVLYFGCCCIESETLMWEVPRQFVYGHFVYDISSTDISSTDISSTTVYQRVGQLYIQLLFQQIIIFINSNFYLHNDLLLSIQLPLTLC